MSRDLSKYLNFLAQNGDRLEHASECELPGLDGVLPLLETTFGDELLEDWLRRKVGELIREVLRSRGWEPLKSNVRLRKGRSRYFKVATTYRKTP